MNMLKEIGIAGPFQDSKSRDILVDPDNFLAQMDAPNAPSRRGGKALRRSAEIIPSPLFQLPRSRTP